jgi:hypothetical protein
MGYSRRNRTSKALMLSEAIKRRKYQQVHVTSPLLMAEGINAAGYGVNGNIMGTSCM